MAELVFLMPRRSEWWSQSRSKAIQIERVSLSFEVPRILVIGSNSPWPWTGIPIVRSSNSPRSEIGETIELGVANLPNLDAQATLEPVCCQAAMAKCFAGVAVGRRFPTQQRRIVPKRDQPCIDFSGVEVIEDFAVQLEIPSGRDGAKPIARFESTQAPATTPMPSPSPLSRHWSRTSIAFNGASPIPSLTNICAATNTSNHGPIWPAMDTANMPSFGKLISDFFGIGS
jgi:hypothetical protein